jgi:hypothetical protein
MFFNPLLMLMCFIFSLQIVTAQSTTTYTFEYPDFHQGQTISSLSGVTFPNTAPTVFYPQFAATSSGSYALRASGECTDANCSSGANSLIMNFTTPVSAVSMRVGLDGINPKLTNCFPENTTCPVYARLTGTGANGIIEETLVRLGSLSDVLCLTSSEERQLAFLRSSKDPELTLHIPDSSGTPTLIAHVFSNPYFYVDQGKNCYPYMVSIVRKIEISTPTPTIQQARLSIMIFDPTYGYAPVTVQLDDLTFVT